MLMTHEEGNATSPSANGDLIRLLEDHGAVLKGHFKLASGRHSDVYVEKFRILERPNLLKQVCQPIVEHFRAAQPDVVVGPSTGGMLVAYEVASQLDLHAVYVETDDQKRRVLKRNGHIDADARVLLVDDVLTTGVSLIEVLAVLEAANAELIGVGVLIDRSEQEIPALAPLRAACRFAATTYAEDDLPDWLARIPLTTPGTRSSVPS